ncbi:MAG: MOSC domain-containing protein [SAR324 cluster bacterium]|nr:MOSC domain-containing protein [SAR324 cluster bacterium]MBL7036002.1 MOSC domain-containing protein [SAR324 cluster bacterium]
MLQPILNSINIYPLKSAGGISLQKTEMVQRGLAFDRRWMIVDDSGKFISQRTHPSLALLQIRLENHKMLLNAPIMPELSLPLFPQNGVEHKVEIWGDRCAAWSAGQQAAQWISEYLAENSEIVFMPDHSNRPVDPNYAPGQYQTAFSDGFPLLLISESSLADLNLRLPEAITMNRFRPNLVLKNAEPYAEDNWKMIKIGNCIFQIVKPCSRCILTTVDPTTGEFSGKEPLKTLAAYRKLNGKVLFGQNLIALKLGLLEVGMPVEITAFSQTESRKTVNNQ